MTPKMARPHCRGEIDGCVVQDVCGDGLDDIGEEAEHGVVVIFGLVVGWVTV